MKVNCLVKYPQEGQVKTRLAEDIGADPAVQVYASILDFTFAFFSSEEGNFPYETTLCYSGASDADFRFLCDGRFELQPQQGTGLGERLHNIAVDHFSTFKESLCLVGSDCLELDIDLFTTCDEMLRDHDIVIGPARDGGYYLLAMNECQATLFMDIDWSSERVFKQTLERAQELNLKVALLPTKSDIDCWQDLPEDLKKKFPRLENISV